MLESCLRKGGTPVSKQRRQPLRELCQRRTPSRLWRATARTTQDLHERIACLDPGAAGTWMMGAAGAVHLARSNASNAQARAFRTPDWSITVPHAGRGTGEGLPRGNHGRGQKAKHFDASSAQRPAEPEHPADDIEHALFETPPARVGGVVAED